MKILLLAGEESGALYAERIRAEVQESNPSVEFRGYGDYGFRISDLAVMGIGQVLKNIFYFLRVKRTMKRAICAWHPDIVCTIDYPGMNLKLAAFAKSHGIRTVHVVCPQVWAWRRGRIPKIEAAVDKLFCFFPFEPSLFKKGFAEFVGHPLVDEMSSEVVNQKRKEDKCGKTLAVLPGSRIGEIEKHLPILLQAIRKLLEDRVSADLNVVIPAANEKAFMSIKRYVLSADLSNLEVVKGGARRVLRRADAAVVASGTATLEAAFVGCPTVLVYRVGWFFAAIARKVIKGVRHIGLANVIAEKAGVPCPMPELLQENLTPENVFAHLKPLLTDESENLRARQKLVETMKLLKSDGDSISKIVQSLMSPLE